MQGTRPFINVVEKKWILYQLFRALQQCHHWGIAHGDITAENVLLTSWHWVYLADFVPFKPAYLPLDDPSDFTFFFNSSGRTAYIAPERFYSSNDATKPAPMSCVDLPESADVFSLGCVAAELFLESPIFDFSQLLAFREGKYDPKPMIDAIEDPFVRQLVHRCVELEPKKRVSVATALAEWDQPWMASLHHYIGTKLSGDCDERVVRIHHDLEALISKKWEPSNASRKSQEPPAAVAARPPVPSVSAFGMVPARSFPVTDQVSRQLELLQGEAPVFGVSGVVGPLPSNNHVMVVSPIDHHHRQHHHHHHHHQYQVPEMVMILSAACSSIRNVRRPRTRLLAIELLVKLARVLDDEVRLERIVPYLMSLMGDAPLIRCNVIDALTDVLAMVQQGEYGLFSSYILPGIAGLSKDPDETVRECFASRLAELATAAKRLLVEPREPATTATTLSASGPAATPQGPRSAQLNTSTGASSTPLPKPMRPDSPTLAASSEKISPRRDLLSQSGSGSVVKATTSSLESGIVGPLSTPTTATRDGRSAPTISGAVDSYDGQLHQLRVAFHALVRDLLEDSSRSVKRRVLLSLTPLCQFFGRRISTETFVPFLITFLSHSNWQLRCVAYQHLLDVMKIVGSKSLEDITVALIGKSFGDSSEHVVAQALQCCKDLIEAKLLRATVMFDICSGALPLMLHCNAFVREAAIGVVLSCWAHISVADRYVFMTSALQPFLTYPVLPHDGPAAVRAALRRPLSRDDLTVSLTVAHDLHKKGLRAGNEQYGTALLGRLKVLGFSEHAAHSVMLASPWMQVHAEGSSSQQQQLEEQALEQKMLQKDAEPISFPGVNVVLDDRSLAPQLAPRLSEEEYRQRYAHNSVTLAAPPTPSDLVSPTLDVLHHNLEGGPGALTALSAAASAGGPGAAVTAWSEWRPRGHLVANLVEHTKAVTSLTVSGDQRFFCSGSLDGTIRVWDSVRLHTIVTNRSRLTCKIPTGGVTCLTMLRDTHCVVSGTSDGFLHLFNVAQTVGANRVPRYSGVHSVASHACQRPVVSVQDVGDSATLIYCTTSGIPQVYDLRARSQPHHHVLDVKIPHGIAVGMAVHPSGNWACVASHSGELTVWDLRFSLAVRSLQLGCGASSILRHNDACVLVAALDNTISSVDVAGDSSRVNTLLLHSPLWSPSSAPVAQDFHETQSVRSLHSALPNSNWVIAGHDDTRLRFWDMARPAESYVIAGPSAPRFVYTHVHPPRGMRLMNSASLTTQESPLPTNARLVGEKSPPAGVVSTSSQTPVYTGHRDSILQVATIAAPHPMCITASRDGVVKAWL